MEVAEAVATPVDREELAALLFRARCQGLTERQLARHYALPLREIQALIDLHCPRIDGARRRRALGTILGQLDALQAVFLPKALAGCHASAAVALKVIERIAVLNALEYAPAKEAVPAHEVEQHRRPTASDLLQAALDRIVNGGTLPQLEAPEPAPPTEPEPSVH